MFNFNRQNLIFGIYLLVPVALAVYVTDHLKLPAWPAFMCMIFFFVEHMDVKKASHIVVGAVAGLGGIALFASALGVLSPLMGLEPGKIFYILALVYAIVAFGEMLPIVFNAYAFMFFTVGGLALEAPEPNPYLWMAMATVGGALLIGSVVLINKIMGAPHPAQPVAE
jgi:hypothetical protein